MKTQQYITKDDVFYLKGKYIIQLNEENFNDLELTDKNLPFYAEKRIKRLVECPYIKGEETKYVFAGIYYTSGKELTIDEIVEYFNSSKENRYYRVMTEKEVHQLISHLYKDFKI